MNEPYLQWGIGGETRDQIAQYYATWGLTCQIKPSWAKAWCHATKGGTYLYKLCVSLLNYKMLVTQKGKLLFKLKNNIYTEL